MGLSSPTIQYGETKSGTFEFSILNVVPLKVREFTAFLYRQYPIVGHTKTNVHFYPKSLLLNKFKRNLLVNNNELTLKLCKLISFKQVYYYNKRCPTIPSDYFVVPVMGTLP